MDIDHSSASESLADSARSVEIADALDIERQLRALPSSHREVLVLQILFGYSTHEMATLLAATEQAVTNRLLRARRVAYHGIGCAQSASSVIEIPCADVEQELLIDSRRLTPTTQEHIAQCAACLRCRAEIEQLNVRLLQVLMRPKVPLGLNDRIMRQLQRNRWHVALVSLLRSLRLRCFIASRGSDRVVEREHATPHSPIVGKHVNGPHNVLLGWINGVETQDRRVTHDHHLFDNRMFRSEVGRDFLCRIRGFDL